MNENDTESLPEALEEEALRRRLINRIAIAGLAIVALLGGLAVIDMLYVAPSTTLTNASTRSSQSTFTPEMTRPVEGVTPLSAVAVAPEEAIPDAQTPPVLPPEPPSPEATPSLKIRSEPEETSSPSVPSPKQVSPIVPTFSKPVQVAAAANTKGRQFIVQMGVFNNIGNAQELLAKLQKIGIPAQIESRVQVGPFKTKAEADAARTKLKAMGLDPGLLMATQK